MEDYFIAIWVGFWIISIAAVILWIWALVDILRSDFRDVAIKIAWLAFVFFVPFVGVIIYLILGKSTKLGSSCHASEKYENLERIKKLYDQGVLSESEYESEKKSIMEQN